MSALFISIMAVFCCAVSFGFGWKMGLVNRKRSCILADDVTNVSEIDIIDAMCRHQKATIYTTPDGKIKMDLVRP